MFNTRQIMKDARVFRTEKTWLSEKNRSLLARPAKRQIAAPCTIWKLDQKGMSTEEILFVCSVIGLRRLELDPVSRDHLAWLEVYYNMNFCYQYVMEGKDSIIDHFCEVNNNGIITRACCLFGLDLYNK